MQERGLFDIVVGSFRQWLSSLPDKRIGKNNHYGMEDAALSAFSVFFAQTPFFLPYRGHPVLPSRGHARHRRTLLERFAKSAAARCTLKSAPHSSKTFEILSKRWIVEHTFGWLNRYRRLSPRLRSDSTLNFDRLSFREVEALSKDYEVYTESSQGMIYEALIRLMLRRMAA